MKPDAGKDILATPRAVGRALRDSLTTVAGVVMSVAADIKNELTGSVGENTIMYRGQVTPFPSDNDPRVRLPVARKPFEKVWGEVNPPRR